MTHFTALLLAGSRGSEDPVAWAAGVAHKPLVEIAGKTMIARVLEAAAAAQAIERIVVVSNIAEALAPVLPEGTLHIDGAAGPPASVLKAVETLSAPFPLLILTADNPLLTATRIDDFCAESLATEAEVTAGLTPSGVVLERFPETRRTFLKFKDERYSGANLFAVLRPNGLKAADFWCRVDKDRKNPTKLAGHFGVTNATLFLSGALTLEEAIKRLSRRIGVRAAAVKILDPLAPVDVDKAEDLELVRGLLEGAA